MNYLYEISGDTFMLTEKQRRRLYTLYPTPKNDFEKFIQWIQGRA